MTVHGAMGISWFSHIDIDAVNRDLRNYYEENLKTELSTV